MDQLPCWRIPALVHLSGTGSEETGAADTLMMFAEGRWINGDGCNPPASGGPTGPVSATCQAKLDAVCNAKANAECIDPTVKLYGKKALPMVGLFDGPGKAWRCYSVLGLDSTHKHWNGTFPGFCSDGAKLAAVFKSECGASPAPAPPPHPASPKGALRAVFSRTSTDGGRSWGTVKLVAGGATAEGERTDPGPMWHAKTKTLVLHVGGATLGAAGRSSATWQLKSTDLGVSFSAPTNISSQLGAAAGFRPGPAGGTTLKSGRMMVAGYGELGQPWPYSQGIDGCVGVWYSDNGERKPTPRALLLAATSAVKGKLAWTVGESWQLANVACDSPAHCNTSAKLFTQKITESVITELPGGGVLLDSRVDGAHLRRAAISKSGQTLLFDSRLAPAGSLLPDAGGNAGGLVTAGSSLFYSNSISAAKDRTHMTVLRSDDKGSSWKRGALIFPGLAAYSDLSTVGDESAVGLAYERVWNDTTVMTGASSSIWFVPVPTDLPPFEHPPLAAGA